MTEKPVRGLGDSKQLTAERREEPFLLIRERATAGAVATAGAAEIDRINIWLYSRICGRGTSLKGRTWI